MLACLDVHYRGEEAVAAAVLFERWEAERGAAEVVERVSPVAPYEPGRFYARELPCLLRLLGRIGPVPDVVLIDGYVWLGPAGEPGLGGHLYAALGSSVAVVGVAKSAFKDARWAVPVLRGQSRRPLFVTAAGLNPAAAADHVARMHGRGRIPTLLAAVDRLCRAGSPPGLRG